MTLIGSLPNDQREVFMMNAIDGYSHQEIGEILGIDEATSRKRLSRAREALRELLSEEESTKPSKKPSVQ
jgi:RNA polymerase sigma factor (sigma-70 family)